MVHDPDKPTPPKSHVASLAESPPRRRRQEQRQDQGGYAPMKDQGNGPRADVEGSEGYDRNGRGR